MTADLDVFKAAHLFGYLSLANYIAAILHLYLCRLADLLTTCVRCFEERLELWYDFRYALQRNLRTGDEVEEFHAGVEWGRADALKVAVEVLWLEGICATESLDGVDMLLLR